MAVTGRQLLDFVNAQGDDEHGVCECRHWWEEHANGECIVCLDNAFDHQFVYSDAATIESEYLNERAREMGFQFGSICAMGDFLGELTLMSPDEEQSL